MMRSIPLARTHVTAINGRTVHGDDGNPIVFDYGTFLLDTLGGSQTSAADIGKVIRIGGKIARAQEAEAGFFVVDQADWQHLRTVVENVTFRFPALEFQAFVDAVTNAAEYDPHASEHVLAAQP